MIRLSDYAKRSLVALWGLLTLFALLMLSGAFLFSLEGSAVATVAAIVLLAAGAMAMVATAGRWLPWR
jgi:hypothetical protein